MLTVDFRKFCPREDERVLDAGCGHGRHTFALYRGPHLVFALDRDHTSLRKTQYVLKEMDRRGEARGRALVVRGDNLCLPFRDNSFHKVICAEVLEHIPDDTAALKELFRVLVPGGELAITVPTIFTEKIYGRLSSKYFRTPGGHIRIYHPKRLCRLITETGLRIYHVGHAHAFHTPYWVLRCLCGLENEGALLPRIYHRFLHRAALDPGVGKWERPCNWLFPKSMVIYAQKPA
jgi:SAM-dependent methyltransferase